MGLFALASLVLAALRAGAAADGEIVAARRERAALGRSCCFTAVLALCTASFAAEREEGLLDALLLRPSTARRSGSARSSRSSRSAARVEIVPCRCTWLCFLAAAAGEPTPSLHWSPAAAPGRHRAWPPSGALAGRAGLGRAAARGAAPGAVPARREPAADRGVTALRWRRPRASRARSPGPAAVYDLLFAVLAWGVFDHVVTE